MILWKQVLFANYSLAIFDYYENKFLSFNGQLSLSVENYINKKLYVHINQFHPLVRERIVTAGKIHFFAHTNVFIDQIAPFERYGNFRSLYYESISSPSLLCT